MEPGPGAWEGRCCAALPGVGATLDGLAARELVRGRTVGGGDARWSFGRRPSSCTGGRSVRDYGRTAEGPRLAPNDRDG